MIIKSVFLCVCVFVSFSMACAGSNRSSIENIFRIARASLHNRMPLLTPNQLCRRTEGMQNWLLQQSSGRNASVRSWLVTTCDECCCKDVLWCRKVLSHIWLYTWPSPLATSSSARSFQTMLDDVQSDAWISACILVWTVWTCQCGHQNQVIWSWRRRDTANQNEISITGICRCRTSSLEQSPMSHS